MLGEPLRADFVRARVGLSAPSPASYPLRVYFAGGSATIPLAVAWLRHASIKYAGTKQKLKKNFT
jgi:hypothetical protein